MWIIIPPDESLKDETETQTKSQCTMIIKVPIYVEILGTVPNFPIGDLVDDIGNLLYKELRSLKEIDLTPPQSTSKKKIGSAKIISKTVAFEKLRTMK